MKSWDDFLAGVLDGPGFTTYPLVRGHAERPANLDVFLATRIHSHVGLVQPDRELSYHQLHNFD